MEIASTFLYALTMECGIGAGGVSGSQGEGRDLRDTRHELSFESLVGNVQDGRRVHGTLVVYFEDFPAVREQA